MIDQNNPSKIFVIFKAVIEQYESIVTEVICDLKKSTQDRKKVNEQLKKLIHNDPESEEAKLIKDKFTKILEEANKITKENYGFEIFNQPIFKSIIDACYQINSIEKLDIIWTPEELRNIKNVLSSVFFGLKITENFELIEAKNKARKKKIYSHNVFGNLLEELFYADRETANELLTKYEKSQAYQETFSENTLMYFYINSILTTKTNQRSYEKLFKLFQDIIGKYYSHTYQSIDKYPNTKQIILNIKMKELIKLEGIDDMSPFKELIKKLNEMIPDLLNKIETTREKKKLVEEANTNNYIYDSYAKDTYGSPILRRACDIKRRNRQ